MFGLASHWLTSSVSNLCKWVEVTVNEPTLPSLGFNHALKATQTIRINKKITVRGGGHCGKGGGDGGCVKCWRWWWWFRKHLGVCVPHPLGQLIIICRPATALSQPAPSASYLFVSLNRKNLFSVRTQVSLAWCSIYGRLAFLWIELLLKVNPVVCHW